MRNKVIYMSVTNDVTNDQRVIRIARTLMKSGSTVFVIGRYRGKKTTTLDLPFRAIRFRLLFKSGPLFYSFFNIRLFFYLLFRKVDILVANDLDTLLPNFLISKLRGKELVYDSHEFFTGVPEIQNRKLVLWIWERIEKGIFPSLKHVYTVSPSIAEKYSRTYGVGVAVVRNFPARWRPEDYDYPGPSDLPDDKKIIILQGTGINVDRGAEEAVDAMNHIQDAILCIIGCGDVIKSLKKRVIDNRLSDRIRFYNRMPYNKLKGYTTKAHLGLSLDKNTNQNYQMSLPNKLFDYIQAGIPVLASDLIEVGPLVKKYGIGELINSHDPAHIAEKMKFMLTSEVKRKEWQGNLQSAAKELCWEQEEKRVIEIYERVGLEF